MSSTSLTIASLGTMSVISALSSKFLFSGISPQHPYLLGFLILGGSLILSGMLGACCFASSYLKNYMLTNMHTMYAISYALSLILVTSVISYAVGSGLPSMKQIALLGIIGLGLSMVVDYVQKILNNIPMLGK